jgi:hypothetical protein
VVADCTIVGISVYEGLRIFRDSIRAVHDALLVNRERVVPIVFN